MKIAVVSEWFSEEMGYAENFLPKALAALGHDVHLLTSDMQVYATSPDYDQIYRSKLGERVVPVGTRSVDGFTLHRMRATVNRLGVHIPDLSDRICDLAPDVVYCFEIALPTTARVASLRKAVGYSMFCESRLHASIMGQLQSWRARAAWHLKNRMLEVPMVLANVERFYPVAFDVLDIIVSRLNVPTARCTVSSLAVETDLFHPYADAIVVQTLRHELGVQESDIVCVYTGRFTQDKGPHLLAAAIDRLRASGHSEFHGLFVGHGDAHYVSTLEACDGCIVRPFVAPRELPNIYRSADIGVWPRQESTSQLDAMACGLPLVISAAVADSVRLGATTLTYEEGDVSDLACKLAALKDRSIRTRMGELAARRIRETCSWHSIASSRVRDFETAKAHPTI